jgi:hypothetical protein
MRFTRHSWRGRTPAAQKSWEEMRSSIVKPFREHAKQVFKEVVSFQLIEDCRYRRELHVEWTECRRTIEPYVSR